ncbi:MAG: hypothetical protein U0796_04130 [Gemmatales bacterium]
MFASLLLMMTTTPAVDNSELVQRAGSTKSVPFAMLPSFAVGRVASTEGVEPTASNLEQWRQSMQPPRAKMLPTRVVYHYGFHDEAIYGSREWDGVMFREHHPWHMIFQYFFEAFDLVRKDTSLKCDLLQVASLHNPEYVGCVTCVPSIECRAKTLEELEKQLLTEYGKHLDKLAHQSVRNHRWIDSNHQSQWIAALPAVNWGYEETWDLMANRRFADSPWVQFGY